MAAASANRVEPGVGSPVGLEYRGLLRRSRSIQSAARQLEVWHWISRSAVPSLATSRVHWPLQLLSNVRAD